MDLSLLTLNLHSYQEHPRYCSFDTMHQHEPEVNIIDEAIAYLKIDVICFQEVGEYMHDPITHGFSNLQ